MNLRDKRHISLCCYYSTFVKEIAGEYEMQTIQRIQYLYLNLEPILKKFCLPEGALVEALSLKKEWCSTAHFHKCLHAFSLSNLLTVAVDSY